MEIENVSYTCFSSKVQSLLKNELEDVYILILEYYWNRQMVIANLKQLELPNDLLVEASLITAKTRARHFDETELIQCIERIFLEIKKQSLHLQEFCV
jgi:hypothetical protein